jgi:hypothetical protein
MPKYAKLFQNMLNYSKICQIIPKYAKLFQNMPNLPKYSTNSKKF